MAANPRGDIGIVRYIWGAPRAPRAPGPLARALHRDDVRFATRFVTLAMAAWLAYETVGVRLAWAASGTRAVTEAVSDALGLDASPGPGVELWFGGGAYHYDLTVGCSGLFVALLFVSAVVAYPARWPQRAVGLLVGLPLLFGVNVARLVSMGWLGLTYPALVEDAHLVWWQAFLILLVGVGWLAWVKLVVERGGKVQALRELAVSALVFSAALLALHLVGRVTGAAAGYERILGHVATVLLRDDAVARSALVTPGFQAAAMAATLALFLATPRVPALSRVRGALLLGAPVAFVCHALKHGAGALSLRSGPSLYALTVSLAMLVPLAAWCGWAWRSGAFARPRPQDEEPPCPACGRRTDDVLAHLRTAHKREQRALARGLLRAHPQLADRERPDRGTEG